MATALCGGGMGDGNLHRHSDLPCLMAGTLGGKFKTGRHLAFKLDTPMSNLLLTILDAVGVRLNKIGDSTGPGSGYGAPVSRTSGMCAWPV